MPYYVSYRVPQEVHAKLINWARWCWLGAWPHPLPPTHCLSAERGYIIPTWADDGAPAPITPPPNAAAAKIVQAAWEELPYLPRLVLRAEYPARKAPRVDEARELHLNIEQYEGMLRIAVGKVEVACAVRASNN